MIAVIDYGAGNLKSVTNALDYLKCRNKVINSPEELKKSDKIIFPGVGSFGDVVARLNKRKLFKPLKEEILNGKPYLGICLGLQILYESSEESPGRGFGIFRGKIKRFGTGLKVPHIGWNQVKIIRAGNLFKDVKNNSFVYFDHSYYAGMEDKSMVTSATDYGVDFISALEESNVCATQFHPEKSGAIGLKILKNFAKC